MTLKYNDQGSNFAKCFCDDLWSIYCLQYPHYIGRIDPIFFHLTIYQNLMSHRSNPGSCGRKLQEKLIQSFRSWIPEIDNARYIDWIDIGFEVVENIQGNTGDYGYSYGTSRIDFDHTVPDTSSLVNHHLFQLLPVYKPETKIENTNLNQEIYRRIKHQLQDLYLSPINLNIPGEFQLFELLTNDIYCLFLGRGKIKQEIDIYRYHGDQNIDMYLYLFQNAVLGNNKSKQFCSQLASSIKSQVMEIQHSGGTIPQHIKPIMAMGCGYSNEQVKDYNQLIDLLDTKICTIHETYISDCFELSIWRYPNKEQTLLKWIIKGNGKYRLDSQDGHITFNNAGTASEYINKILAH